MVILNRGEDSSFEEDFAKDVQEIITVFSAGFYDRSRINTKLIQRIKHAAEAWSGE